MTNLDSVIAVKEKLATTAVPIHELMARRWSPRAFAHNKNVTAQQLTALLEAARWAPSCFGDQPWRFIVGDRARDAAAWDAIWQTLTPGNRVWAQDAPVLIAIVADTQFQHNDKPNRWGAYDTGAAAFAMMLEAVAQGLATHQMGGFDAAALRDATGIPPRYTPMAVMAVGYATTPGHLPADLQERECATRVRRPLAETVYAGRWGGALVNE